MVEHGLWTEKEWIQTIEKIISEIQNEFPLSKIIVKIHPVSESLEKYSNLIKKIGNNIKILQREDLIETISKSDIVITYGQSSSVLQAALLEKPIIVVNLFNYPLEKMPFLKEGIGIELNDIHKLKDIVTNIHQKDIKNNVKNYINKHLYKFDGNVSERASNAIIEIIEKYD
jgi:capsule polysaccharide modification protein KpsS